MILIDTHVLIWLVHGNPRLGMKARAAIDRAAAAGALHISSITPWEIAMLDQKGRLSLGKDVSVWIKEALDLPGVQLTPFLPSIAVDSVRLPAAAPADPADRIIIASARHLGVGLLSADKPILRYGRAGYVAVQDASK